MFEISYTSGIKIKYIRRSILVTETLDCLTGDRH